jgi:hypothetical protein
MLTDKQLGTLKAADKVYKVADQQGLYVTVLRTGNISFRYDYRLNGRRETLVIGRTIRGSRPRIHARCHPWNTACRCRLPRRVNSWQLHDEPSNRARARPARRWKNGSKPTRE